MKYLWNMFWSLSIIFRVWHYFLLFLEIKLVSIIWARLSQIKWIKFHPRQPFLLNSLSQSVSFLHTNNQWNVWNWKLRKHSITINMNDRYLVEMNNKKLNENMLRIENCLMNVSALLASWLSSVHVHKCVYVHTHVTQIAIQPIQLISLIIIII